MRTEKVIQGYIEKTYDDKNNLIKEVSSDGFTSEYGYDKYGRVVWERSSSGISRIYDYSGEGEKVMEKSLNEDYWVRYETFKRHKIKTIEQFNRGKIFWNVYKVKQIDNETNSMGSVAAIAYTNSHGKQKGKIGKKMKVIAEYFRLKYPQENDKKILHNLADLPNNGHIPLDKQRAER